jgi:hypothetical protein
LDGRILTKRELAILLDFNIMVEKSKEKALELFRERKNRYTNYWVKRFISESIKGQELIK